MNLKRVVAAVGRLPVVSSLIRQPAARGLLKNIPGVKLLYGSGWDAVHPFDRIHGTDTSGFVSADQLPSEEAARVHAVLYAGSQQRVEAALRTGLRSIYIIYYNPTAAHCFDASALLTRRFARRIPYAAGELGYGPDESDLVIIWQGGPAPAPAAAQ